MQLLLAITLALIALAGGLGCTRPGRASVAAPRPARWQVRDAATGRPIAGVQVTAWDSTRTPRPAEVPAGPPRVAAVAAVLVGQWPLWHGETDSRGRPSAPRGSLPPSTWVLLRRVGYWPLAVPLPARDTVLQLEPAVAPWQHVGPPPNWR